MLDLHQLHRHIQQMLWVRGREERAQIWKETQAACYRQCTAAQTVCICVCVYVCFCDIKCYVCNIKLYKHMIIEVHLPILSYSDK